MKKVLFLSAALLLCISISAENFSDNPLKEKKSNRAVGASLMGKTFQCDGVSMSYLIAEQGTMAFGASVNFEYERKINKTPLGIVTGIWAEYSRPYYSGLDDYGNQLHIRVDDLTLRVPVMMQYHDKLGTTTELLLFAGPSLDFVTTRSISRTIRPSTSD